MLKNLDDDNDWHGICYKSVDLYNQPFFMKPDSLTSTYNRLKRYIAENRVGSALSELDVMAQAASSPWQITTAINRLRENYAFLCRYALDGASDPSRQVQYDQIKSGIEQTAQSILRNVSIKESPRLYFGILRFENTQKDSDIATLLQQYISNYSTFSLAILGGTQNPHTADGTDLRKALESQSQRIFNRIWVTHPLSADDITAIEAALANETLPLQFKRLIISALMIGIIDYYDESKMEILARAYTSDNDALQIYAAVALILSMWNYRYITPGAKLSAIMEAIKEKPLWHADLHSIFKIFARTRDTERIVRTLNEEVIPDMIKLRPDLEKRLGKQSIEEIMDDSNPEWEEMMNKSKLADKLKEISNLQEEGCDVMMATFSRLKGFPFFNEPANWFLPFDRSNSNVRDVLGSSDSDLAMLIERSMPMCDSDKYSMVMALSSMPQENRRAMLNQFEALGNQNSEMLNSMLNPHAVSRENTAGFYIQDVFRFYTLFRRKSEFRNPFLSPINLTAIPALTSSLSDAEAIRPIAEFYFKRKYYPEALELFEYIESLGVSDPLLFQKAGYCHQREGRFEKALGYYRKSELLHPDSAWTLRRIALCLKNMGQITEALEYYRKVEATSPDDVALAITIGNCAIETGNIADALKAYYKADFLGDKTGNALRGLAWGNFLKGDYDKSLTYFDRLLASGSMKKNDYINAGHLMMALGRYRDAVDRYVMSIHTDNMRVDNFEDSMRADRHFLERAGVNPLITDIVIDTVISEAPIG